MIPAWSLIVFFKLQRTLLPTSIPLPPTTKLPRFLTIARIKSYLPNVMDPLSAGASVLAFLTLGLKTATTIHQILSSFKNAPQAVLELNHDVTSLSAILERLLKCTHAANSTDAPFKSHLDQCTKDLSDIEIKLRSFSAPSHSRSSRVLNNVRTVWKEKDLEQARSRIRDHCTQLNLHLGLIQVEVNADISSALTNHASSTAAVLQQLLDGYAKLQDRLDTNAAATLSDIGAPNVTTDGCSSGIVEPEVMDVCSDLEESIVRLCNLVEMEEPGLDSEDAQQIIDDVERLVQDARDRVCSAHIGPPRDDENRCERRDWKFIEGIINTAPVLAINKTCTLLTASARCSNSLSVTFRG
ncbi:hypothetical protein G7046_g1499 [Stylonectria norvegica]|nr:hypothetical protein G7046_g1499 [Stylonectria norvegica]